MSKSSSFMSKKSWHVSTIKNQKKIWELEKEKEEENKKLEQWKREKEEQDEITNLRTLAQGNKRVERLDWMYEGGYSLINNNNNSTENQKKETVEEYLLGKKIDDTKDDDIQKLKSVSGSLFIKDSNSTTISSPFLNKQELKTRSREDPLQLILLKQKESIERAKDKASSNHLSTTTTSDRILKKLKKKEKIEKKERREKEKIEKKLKKIGDLKKNSTTTTRGSGSSSDHHADNIDNLDNLNQKINKQHLETTRERSDSHYRDRDHNHHHHHRDKTDNHYSRDRDIDRYRDYHHHHSRDDHYYRDRDHNKNYYYRENDDHERQQYYNSNGHVNNNRDNDSYSGSDSNNRDRDREEEDYNYYRGGGGRGDYYNRDREDYYRDRDHCPPNSMTTKKRYRDDHHIKNEEDKELQHQREIKLLEMKQDATERDQDRLKRIKLENEYDTSSSHPKPMEDRGKTFLDDINKDVYNDSLSLADRMKRNKFYLTDRD